MNRLFFTLLVTVIFGGCFNSKTGVDNNGLLAKNFATSYFLYCNAPIDLESLIIRNHSTTQGFEKLKEVWARPLKKSWVDNGRSFQSHSLVGTDFILSKFVTTNGDFIWYSSGYEKKSSFYAEKTSQPDVIILKEQYINVYMASK
jgi:hypothetical protein